AEFGFLSEAKWYELALTCSNGHRLRRLRRGDPAKPRLCNHRIRAHRHNLAPVVLARRDCFFNVCPAHLVFKASDDRFAFVSLAIAVKVVECFYAEFARFSAAK